MGEFWYCSSIVGLKANREHGRIAGVVPSAAGSRTRFGCRNCFNGQICGGSVLKFEASRSTRPNDMSLLHFRCKERRRTQRVTLTVPLALHGENEDGSKFCIHVKSNDVSQHGAQIECEYPLVAGQVVLLVNESSARKTEARVASVRRKRDGKTHVGFEFLSTEINFWAMTFPLPGAKPLRRSIHKVTQSKVTNTKVIA